MKNIYKILVIHIFLFNICNVFAKSKDDFNEYYYNTTVLDSIVKLTHSCLFDDALSRVNECLAENPSSFQWRFIRIVILWREIYFKGFNKNIEDMFKSETKQLLIDGEKKLSNEKSNLYVLFYVGAAYGYLGQYEAAKQKMFSGAKLGKKGIDYLDVVIKKKPDWYDAYLSIGVFHFYASNVPWYLKPILSILGQNGSEKKAIEYLTLVSKKGRIANFTAQENLAELFVRRKEFNVADSLYKDLIRKFPCCINYHYKLISINFNLKYYDSVVEIGSRAIQRFETSNNSKLDLYQLGLIYIMVAQGYEALCNTDMAIENYTLLIERGNYKPLFSFAYLSRAKLFEKKLDIIKAIESYNWVVKNSSVKEHIKEAYQRLNFLSK